MTIKSFTDLVNEFPIFNGEIGNRSSIELLIE